MIRLALLVVTGGGFVVWATGRAIEHLDAYLERRRAARKAAELVRCTECYALVRHGEMPAHWTWHDSLDQQLREVVR
jgi:hypothetical protein